MDKRIRAAGMGILLAVWVTLAAFAWFGPKQTVSESERRPLAQMPALSGEALLSGGFAAKVEDAAVDQFPMRDTLRSAKALFSRYVLGQKDNNGIYLTDGYAAKLEYPLNMSSVTYALDKLQYLHDTYLQESKVVMAVVPDKGRYLAARNGYPAMDYEYLLETVRGELDWAQHVDLTDVLSLEDYYRTDTHWRQEKLLPVAKKLAQALDVSICQDYRQTVLDIPFYGVYYGQAALPMQPDTITILENDLLENCRIYNYETGQYSSVYDLEKQTGTDPYDVYLSGAQALLTIENPGAETDRELIVFRDSFGSSIVPLLVRDYARVTLVDIRYIRSDLLGEYLDFHGQDVLLLYSTLILNSSKSLK